jgi:uncharacterized protein involved in exopolysaccharide biosynthesis
VVVTDNAGLRSKRVAVLVVSVLALFIGVILAVQVNSRPAYEATAEFRLGLDDPTARPDLAEERLVFQSPRIAHDAEALASHLNSERFVWYQPDPDVAPAIDSDLILRSLRIETNAERDEISIHFTADEPAVARVGANLVVEAYRQLRPEVGRPSCWGPNGRWADCPPLEPPTVTSLSFAPTPTNRVDRPDPADVRLYVLGSMLAVFLTWRWWPTAVREATA